MGIDFEIRKKYRDFSLDLSLKCDSKRIGILGASGCGKTMTLKALAGLVRPDEGHIAVDGRVLFDSGASVDIPARKRNIGYLFQNYALFPNMTVEENIRAALHGAGKCGRGQKSRDIEEILASFDLTGLRHHMPHELSGGQQQRTALARMLSCDPGLILLDEPFSAMDTFMREALRLELIRILDKYDRTVILVSHDRDEIYQMCDYLVLMDKGRLIADGPTKEIFAAPGSLAAARLTGCKNISRIERLGEYRFRALDWQGLELETDRPIGDGIGYAGIRAHDFVPEETGVNLIPVGNASVSTLPFEWYVITGCGLWWKIPRALSDEDISGNIPPFIRIPPDKIILMER